MVVPGAISVDWPFFACREDNWLDLSTKHSGKVLRCFNSGFDVELSGKLVFFTGLADALHPHGVLIPSGLLPMVSEGQKVTLSEKLLIIDKYELQQAECIGVSKRPVKFDSEAVKDNLLTLHSNLKLFGRSSIVLKLVLGCHSGENILSGAEHILIEPELDMTKLKSYIGVGEGLTPAFDDFLTGMIFIDRFFGINQIALPDDFLPAISAQTTRQAVQQLEFASRGAISLKFENFASNLAQRPVRTHEIMPLLHWGHSSGTDILCGVWYYLAQRVRI